MADNQIIIPSYKELILINKPSGISSNGVLGKIKSIIRRRLNCRTRDLPKIGHGGTLDPLASGLLVVGIGRGTKLMNEQINTDKIYTCSVDLLKSSETGDLESFVQHKLTDINLPVPTLEQIQSLIVDRFSGEIDQTPPIYSALKVDGKKAYELARAGETPVLKPRRITIYSVDVVDYEFPILKLKVHCSKGTYIRTLGSDIGRALGFYGTLIELNRIRSGSHSIDDAIELDKLEYENLII